MDQDEKAALQARGIGLAKTHVYIAEGDTEKDPDMLVVSMADYFEGDKVEITVFDLDAAGEEGTKIPGIAGEESAGKIADSTTKICSRDTCFELPKNRSVRVIVTYTDKGQVVDITPGARSGWIDWMNI